MALPKTLCDREQAKFILDKNGDTAVNTVINNSSSNPVPVAIISGVDNESIVNTYDTAAAVATSTLTTIVSYTVPVGDTFFLQLVEMGGENIACYDIIIGGTQIAKVRTYFGGSLTAVSRFVETSEKGLEVAAGTTIDLKVTHNRPMSGDFEGRILGVLQV